MSPLLLVLIVIQDAKMRALVRKVLEGGGHRIVDAAGISQAQLLLSNGLDPDLVLCQVSPQDIAEHSSSRQFLQLAHSFSTCLITTLSGQTIRNAASAMGVQNFLTAPLTREDIESLVDSVSLSQREIDAGLAVAAYCANDSATRNGGAFESRCLPEDVPAVPYIEELGDNNFFLAASPQMLEIQRQVKLLAHVDVNVLILGESGTGKEIVAQLIHKNSRRSREKFLKVNCAALPADLLESELFGHRQGAFTGAISDKAGKFEQADRGTLLLDEIGELGVQMQAKLLHVLQDGRFARLGAQETSKVDVRVLAATNVQMEDALFARTFREDLYYRLSVVTIKMPPLRERREDIPFLIEQFIHRAPVDLKNGCGHIFPSRLIDVALLYDWWGNVRELWNFVTRTMVMRDPDAATRELEAKVAESATRARLESPMEAPAPCVGFRSIVRDVKARTEAEMIRNALEVCGWNRRRAAQHLHISYRALLYKIQQHQLRPWSAAEPEEALDKAQSAQGGAA